MTDAGARSGTGAQQTAAGRPGPVYDRVMRRVAERDLATFCAWLAVEVAGPPELVHGSFPATTLNTDLLVRVHPTRLLNVEYTRVPGADLAVRMVGYRARIMAAHPGVALTQIVLVLGDGLLRSCDDPESGFRLGLQAVYLRECDPRDLLAVPSLAPLAVLARGDRHTRAQVFFEAIRVIQAAAGEGDGAQHGAAELLEAASTLATIRLDAPTINQIRRETGMTVESIADFYSETDFGKALIDRGVEQGLEQATVRTLNALLGKRFPQAGAAEVAATAQRLASWPDLDAAIDAVLAAPDLAHLVEPGA